MKARTAVDARPAISAVVSGGILPSKARVGVEQRGPRPSHLRRTVVSDRSRRRWRAKALPGLDHWRWSARLVRAPAGGVDAHEINVTALPGWALGGGGWPSPGAMWVAGTGPSLPFGPVTNAYLGRPVAVTARSEISMPWLSRIGSSFAVGDR